jgi:DUF1009 family protein
VEEDLAISNIVEGEQEAIGRAALLYMESRSCRKRTFLSKIVEREQQVISEHQYRI